MELDDDAQDGVPLEDSVVDGVGERHCEELAGRIGWYAGRMW